MIKKITTFLVILSSFYTNMLAEDMSDIPQESEVFYTEELPTSLLMSKKISRASSRNSYKVTTTILNCFDESLINTQTNAWFVTSDGSTQLSINLQFTEDDDRYTIASYEISSYFYEGDNLFQDDSKELITDVERFVGKYEPTNTEKSITVKWTAPEVFPYTTSPYYTFYMVIKVNFKNGGIAYVGKNLGVSRTGLLLLHGLNDSYTIFEPFRDYLINSGAFIGSQIFNKDYSNSNSSSFYYNTYLAADSEGVVKDGLKKLSKRLYNAKIVSTKYDMIGHSMGGILERLYNQEIDNEHTYRLITLNTPHFGAPLGNLLGDMLEKLSNSVHQTENANIVLKKIDDSLTETFHFDGVSKSAVKDLAYNSDAINKLGSTVSKLSGIPCYAVGSYIQTDRQVSEDFYFVRNLSEDATFLMAHIFYNNVPNNRYSFLLGENVDGDGIVSITSQKGGLSEFTSIFNGSILDNLDSYAFPLGGGFHCNTPKCPAIQNELLLLLRSYPDENNFCMTGFKASSPEYKTRSVLCASDASSEYIETFAEPKSMSFIHINMEEVKGKSYTHKATVTHSDDMATTMVFSILSKDRMISGYDQNEMKFDLSDWEGEYTFYAIGRTNYDALVMDSVVVKVNNSTGIKNTYAKTASKIKCTAIGNQLKVEGVDGAYNINAWDITGRIVLSTKNNSSDTYALPVANGLYIVRIEMADGYQTFKIKTNTNQY